ncbi:hypothetical protein [Streptomyces sp. A012304]|uniref:hypothetical protein n=1 Tax=Streptomyces sp. A012304 TaxID=375446 RepID=UPI00222EF7BB|nr:hypothetical protein [Streptomyces sp. A012304]GKQ37927.1 hypothetical protein ALMP_44620 [Streptomyces sp. A012304]
MPRISCHFPITVSVVGEPSAADLEELGRIVEEALAARLNQARNHLATVSGREPARLALAQEPLRADRIDEGGRDYRVPSYEGGGALKSVPLATAAGRTGDDPAVLSDAELDTEYAHARDWLLGHPHTDPAHATTEAYLRALEGELNRRSGRASPASAAGAPPTATPAVPQAGPPLPPVPVAGPPPPTDAPLRVTAAHAGGAYGEHDLPFLLGERGFRMVITSSGTGAHRLTGHGVDAIAVHPQSGELWLIDNKASGSTGPAKGGSATALGRNLRASLEEATAKVRAMPDFPEKADVLRRLEGSLTAVRAGRPIPPGLNVKLKVTNAGGYASHATGLPRGVEFEDLVGPDVRAARRADVTAAGAAGVAPGRPASHSGTEAARRRVGGALSRQPLRVPVKVRFTSGLRGGGIGLLKIVGAVVQVVVGARLRQEYETRKIQEWTEPELKAMEPEIQTRVENRLEELVDLQLARPGQPVYAVVEILVTIHRKGSGERLIGAEAALVSVSVGAERVERTETNRVTTGIPWVTGEWPHDLVRTTHSIELEPLGRADLIAVLRARIEAEESSVAESSMTPEEHLASQRRRDALVRRLAELEAS